MSKLANLRIALATSTVLVSGLLFVATPAYAQASLPDTGHVTAVTSGLSGGVPGSTNPTFNTTGAAGAQTLTVNLNDNRTILNWGGAGFKVTAGNTVNFADARAVSGVSGRTDNIAVLNRDMSGQLSNLYGTIKSDANVAVYVINSNGISFGPSSTVNTGSFFGSTLDLTDTNFLNQPTSLSFSGPGNYSQNPGIKLAPGAQIHTTATSSSSGGRIGDLVLIGGVVFGNDTGALRSLTATNGDVAVIAADAVTIQNAPGSPLAFTITRGSPESLATTLVDIAANISGRNVTVATAKNGPGNLGQGIQLDGMLTATGAAQTDRGVVLTAGQDAPGVTMGASFTRADPGSDVHILGSLSSANGVTIRTGTDSGVILEKSIVAAGTVVVDAPYLNDFDTVGITGSDVSLPNQTYVAGKTTATNGNITLLTDGGGGAVSFLGGAQASGNVTGITGEFTTGDLVAGGLINLSVFDGTFNGKVHATGPVTIDLPSVYGRLTFNGDVTSDSTMRITTLGHLTGGQFIAGGSLYLEGDSTLTASDVSGVDGVTLIADGFSNASSIFDNGRIRINSVTTGSNGDVYLRSLQLFGVNDGRASSLIAGRNMEISTDVIDVATIKGLSGSVKLTASTTSPTYGNYIRVDDLFAGTTLTASSIGGVQILGATAKTGDMTLTGSSVLLGPTTASSNFIVGGNFTINSSGSAQLHGSLTGGGDLNITGTNITLGTSGAPNAQVRVKGAINLTATTSNVAGGGNVTLQSNSDGIGDEAITISSATFVSFSTGTSLLGGTAQQSDVRIRSSSTGLVQFGDVSAHALLGAIGSDPFTNGITRNASVLLRGNVSLIDSLYLQGTSVSVAGPISVTAGDIDLRSDSASTISGAISASGNISARTSAGDLTLAASTSLTGHNVILSTPGAFINNAGASAINASGHWVIYSANPTDDTFGGLDSGDTALWDSTLATRDPSTVTGNRYVFTFQPTLTFATQDFSKVYGTDLTGSSSIPFSVTGYQPGVAGAFLADTAATAYSGAPLISSAGFAPRATVAGGPYALSIGSGTLASDAGYAFAFNSPGQLTVTPKELTGVVDAASKTYDGTRTGSGTITLDGIVAGDTVDTTGTSFTFSDKNAGPRKTVTVTGTTLTGADAGNYTLTIPATALADILKAALTGTVTVNNKTYDGTTTGSGSVTLNGVIAGDSVGTTGTSFTFADKNAGNGKTVSVGGTTLTGADAGNYTLTLPASVLGDILRAALTGTATVNNKTYDGTTTGSGSITLNGVVAGDHVGTTGTSFTFADKNAGSGRTVAVGGTTLTGADAGNYTLTLPASVLGDILRAALTGTATVNNKTYDGTTTGSGSITLNGVVAGDHVGTTGTSFTFADKNAGSGRTVAVSGTTLTGADAGNYTLTLPATVLGDILRAALTGTATVNNKTYDGTTTGSGSITLNGVVAGDHVGTTGTSFTFADKNAGSGRTVAVGGTTLTGADAGNYTLTIPATALGDILKAALTGTVAVNNKTYDGTTAGSGSVTLSGVVAGDTVGTTGTHFTFGDKNAGNGKTVTVTGTTLTGADAGNYTLMVPATALADILKAALTGTVTVNNKTYDGTTAGSGSVALNGVVTGDSVGTTGTNFTFADKNAGNGKTVTVSGTTLTGADAGNYTVTIPASALADILKKALTGTITIDGKTYDGTTAATGSVALSGVVAGDIVGTSGSSFAFADKNAGTGKVVAVSGTTLNGADAGNYTLTLPSTALGDINRRILSLAADNLTKIQGADDPLFTYTITSGSLVSGDSLSGALTRATGELPGRYAITQGSLSAGGNYTLNFTPGTLTINLSPLNQQPQTLRALTLPSQVQAQPANGNNVTIDQKDLCGDDKNCVVR